MNPGTMKNYVHPSIIAAMYGTARKIYQLSGDPNVTVVGYDCESGKDILKKASLYTTTKGALIATCGLASVYLWPYYLGRDIYMLEAYYRKDTIKSPESVFDYIIT